MENRRSSRRQAILQGFFDRRKQAWERVFELEERAGPARFADRDFKRVTELLKEGDAAGLRRLQEQWEEPRRKQEEAAAEAARARRRVMLRFELPFALMGLVTLLAIAALPPADVRLCGQLVGHVVVRRRDARLGRAHRSASVLGEPGVRCAGA